METNNASIYNFDWDLELYQNEPLDSSSHVDPLDEWFNEVCRTPHQTIHREEVPLFDQMDLDQNISETLLNDLLSQSAADENELTFIPPDDILEYLKQQPTATPVTRQPTLKSSSSSVEKAMKKSWFIYDRALGRERRPLLYEFLRLLVEDPDYDHLAEYLDRKQGIFKLHKPKEVARMWKDVKSRNSDTNMTYEKLARAIRHYYSTGIMHSAEGRFTFRFGVRSGFHLDSSFAA